MANGLKGLAAATATGQATQTFDALLHLFQGAVPDIEGQHKKGKRACSRLAATAGEAYSGLFEQLDPAGLGDIFPDWQTYADQGPFASLLAVYQALRDLPGERRQLMASNRPTCFIAEGGWALLEPGPNQHNEAEQGGDGRDVVDWQTPITADPVPAWLIFEA